MEAFAAYAARYGNSQSAERLAERGGFSVGELDMFVPGWEGRTDVDWSRLLCRVPHCEDCAPYRRRNAPHPEPPSAP